MKSLKKHFQGLISAAADDGLFHGAMEPAAISQVELAMLQHYQPEPGFPSVLIPVDDFVEDSERREVFERLCRGGFVNHYPGKAGFMLRGKRFRCPGANTFRLPAKTSVWVGRGTRKLSRMRNYVTRIEQTFTHSEHDADSPHIFQVEDYFIRTHCLAVGHE